MEHPKFTHQYRSIWINWLFFSIPLYTYLTT